MTRPTQSINPGQHDTCDVTSVMFSLDIFKIRKHLLNLSLADNVKAVMGSYDSLLIDTHTALVIYNFMVAVKLNNNYLV
jgi:hypothetical protein